MGLDVHNKSEEWKTQLQIVCTTHHTSDQIPPSWKYYYLLITSTLQLTNTLYPTSVTGGLDWNIKGLLQSSVCPRLTQTLRWKVKLRSTVEHMCVQLALPNVEVLHIDILVGSGLPLAPQEKTLLCRGLCREEAEKSSLSMVNTSSFNSTKYLNCSIPLTLHKQTEKYCSACLCLC